MYTIRLKNTTMSISLRKLTIGLVQCSDIPKAVDFLVKNYFPVEPLAKSLSITDDPEALEQLKKFCTDLLYQNVSVVATTNDGEIAGIACNAVIRKNQPPIENWKHPSLIKITDFVDIATKEADIFTKYPDIDQYLHIFFLSVNEDDRDHGLVKRLVEFTKETAIKLGLKLIRIDICNSDCAKIAQKRGWTCLSEIRYDEYMIDGEEIFKMNEKDNKTFGVYAMRTDNGGGFFKSVLHRDSLQKDDLQKEDSQKEDLQKENLEKEMLDEEEDLKNNIAIGGGLLSFPI